MRGVISAGMVSGLESLGYVDAFDAVYGASAGAINAAYFLAGQARLGTSIYYEDINNRHFISRRRALVGRPIVNLGYLIDDIARTRKPLDLARVLGASSPLSVLATDVASGDRAVFSNFRNGTALLQALRAGATMPVVAGPPRPIDGRRYLDASLSEPIPVPSAEAGGCTHILVLLTRDGSMHRQPSSFDRYFVAPRLRRLSPELARRYLRRAEPYDALLRHIEAGTGPLERSAVTALRVSGHEIGKLERQRSTLEEAAAAGEAAVRAALGSSGPADTPSLDTQPGR